MKHKYILMCALAMTCIATQAQDEVYYDISNTPATEVVEGHIYLLANRAYPEIGLVYDSNEGSATTFDPVSEQLGQSVTSNQPFLFTATADGFTLPVTLENINDVFEDWGYGDTSGGTVLSRPSYATATNEPVYFAVKDASGQYVIRYNGGLYGVNATTPAPEAQWIAYEVKEHEHKWAPNEDRTHYCTVCNVEEEHSYVDGVCEICQHECGHSSYIDGVCEYCGAECEHKNGWEFNEEDDYWHYCIVCYHQEHHHIAEEGGACDCGFICPGHEFFFDSEVSISASNEATGEYVMHFECVFCQYQKTETVDPDAECPNGDQHSWDVWVEKPTCTMRGYTYHQCTSCDLMYISDFTDIDRKNHNWQADNDYHWCGNGCELYGQDQEHNMVDGKCTICGYWPGHTEHQWEAYPESHRCTIPGCEEHGESQEHTRGENCVCTFCGYTEHCWYDGECENCGAVCYHENPWYEEARDATCFKNGNKAYYACVCNLFFADADCKEKITWEDILIPATGHQFDEEHHCTVCDRSITIGSTITLGEAAYVNFINYCGRYNEEDPTAEPLYKIELTKAAYNFSISEELESPSIAIFDKDFNCILTVDVDEPKSLEAGTYYLLPSAYLEEEDEDEGGYVEFAGLDVPLTITRIESITLSTDDVTDENGDAVVLTLTDDGSYATEQNVVLDDSKNFYSDIEFSVPEVTYTRDISGYAGSDWGTLCLPFDYTVAEATAVGLSIYELTDASAEAVTVTRKTEGTVAYGTPVLFKKTGEGDGATLNLTAADTKMGYVDDPRTNAVNGLYMLGALMGDYVNTGYYLDTQDGKLHSIEEWCSANNEDEIFIPAYRAWFDRIDGDSNEARSLNVEIEDETSALDAIRALIQGKARIYGLDGRERNDLQPGVNIVNGMKVIVK